MKAYKITNPLRFFGFFGLFLIFMFMAVKSCSDRTSKTEFVSADEIARSVENTEEKGNSAELEEFIEDVKEGIENKKKPQAKKADKKKPLKITKKEVKPVKKETPNIVKAAPKKTGNLNSLVKGSGNNIDSLSKAQLKKDVGKINAIGKGKVTVYGSYFPGEAKTKGFVRAAKIKNELIRFGLKNSMTVYILPESQSRTDRFGRIKYSK